MKRTLPSNVMGTSQQAQATAERCVGGVRANYGVHYLETYVLTEISGATLLMELKVLLVLAALLVPNHSQSDTCISKFLGSSMCFVRFFA